MSYCYNVLSLTLTLLKYHNHNPSLPLTCAITLVCPRTVWSLANNADNKARFSEDNTLIEALTAAAGLAGDIKVKAMGALNYLAPNVKV